MGEKLAFVDVEGYSSPPGPFLDKVELEVEVLAEFESCTVAACQAVNRP